MKCIIIWHMMKNTGKIKFEIVIFRGVDFGDCLETRLPIHWIF